ncbi:cytochrome p450 alkane hydroxylase [Diplodia corticola]|uniref:Cytochrome p450 alkane hydroxylase n=1 Tax=Diplodia corticola TaxID=236234 RepID=A0A1J9QWX6_9PEZI|nr:cytochrome p450 alkane hydroxylase [Diplodia corticola]OJD32490.1 cytochrome p450 alkane hydroxylase [Diplodia corticola]
MLNQLLGCMSLPSFAAFAILLYLVYGLANRINAAARLRALGGCAPVRATYFPLGLDLVFTAVRANLRHASYEFWLHLFRTVGRPGNAYTVEADVGGVRTIFTADPVNIKALLATQFADYGKGERFNQEWHDFLGDSIFTTDGAKWHSARQLIRPQFVKDRLSDIQVFERHISVLLKHLGGSGEAVDITTLFFRYTLDAATDFLLGRSVESLDNPQAKFAEAFAEVQHVQSLIAKSGPVNWLLPRKRFRDNIQTMNDFIEPFIDQALSLPAEELDKRTKDDEGYTFLHALASYTRDRATLRDQLAAVLLAGRDTTACTLSWLFYELSNHPKIVQKLREEILGVVGDETMPTYEHLKSMKYLQHTINETLRLYPVVPFNIRSALRDTTLPHGGGSDGSLPIGVLRDTPIAYSTLVMQRRADLHPPVSKAFPPVLSFAPERWYSWTPKAWTYIPFNGGPRICIGQQFALTEMAYTVVRILQCFKGVENRTNTYPGLKTDIVLQPAKEIFIAFQAK